VSDLHNAKIESNPHLSPANIKLKKVAGILPSDDEMTSE
jgi:hypothetical protein